MVEAVCECICLNGYDNIKVSFFLYIFQGRGFNVQVHYVVEPVPDYVRAAVSTVFSIHDQVISGV